MIRRAMDCIREACLSVYFVMLAVGTCDLWVQSIHSIQRRNPVAAPAGNHPSAVRWDHRSLRWTFGSFILDATTTFNKNTGHSITLRSVGSFFNTWAMHASTNSIPRHGAITSQMLYIPEAWLYRPSHVQICSILSKT